MTVVIDTHVLYWILTQDTTRLTSKALNTLTAAKEIILPSIILLELFGLLQKKGALKYFDLLIRRIPKSRYTIYPLDLVIIKEVRRIKALLELHDKVITATAKHLNIAVISKDTEITKAYKRVIW